MAKYRKFYFSAGYYGTETESVFKFPDEITEKEIEQIFEDWAEEQRNDTRECIEITEEEALQLGIEDEYE